MTKFQEIEQGRGDDSGNLIASQRNADLPWNRPSDIGIGKSRHDIYVLLSLIIALLVGDFDVLQGAASSQTGTNLGAGRISMDTPNALLCVTHTKTTYTIITNHF